MAKITETGPDLGTLNAAPSPPEPIDTRPPAAVDQESTGAMLARLGTDAMAWAEEIEKRHLTTADDLLGWCANMMQAAADAAVFNQPDPSVKGLLPEGRRDTFTITLKPQFADYVRERAADHGRTPEDEINFIVRAFWQQFDEWRRERIAGAARPGKAPV